MKRAPVPIWLVTGHLGSGKTTLLSRWLREPSLAEAVLVINEIGEVGFDDQLLAQAVDSAKTASDINPQGMRDVLNMFQGYNSPSATEVA